MGPVAGFVLGSSRGRRRPRTEKPRTGAASGSGRPRPERRLLGYYQFPASEELFCPCKLLFVAARHKASAALFPLLGGKAQERAGIGL